MSLYKKEKESAEGRESALRTEMEEERSRAANRPPPADEGGEREAGAAGAGVEKTSMTATTGMNTEEVGCSGGGAGGVRMFLHALGVLEGMEHLGRGEGGGVLSLRAEHDVSWPYLSQNFNVVFARYIQVFSC